MPMLTPLVRPSAARATGAAAAVPGRAGAGNGASR